MSHYVLLALGVVAVAACSSDNNNHTTGPAATGNLLVTVTTPAGVTPAITVAGPNAYSATIAATDTLKTLKLGSYTIVGDTVSIPDSVIGAVINTGAVSGSPATVAANATAQASVTYAQTGSVGGLWVAVNSGTSVSGFASSQLRASSAPAPADTIGGFVNSAGVAVDGAGNLWVSSFGIKTLEMYTPTQQSGGGTPTPAVQITSQSLLDPEEMAFDANGTLWVVDRLAGLVGFTKNQLTATGTVTAAITVTLPVGGAANAMAFDAEGNAWIAELSDGNLLEFTASQLASSGAPTPATVITPANPAMLEMGGLAFDASGNLWLVSEGYAFAYTPAQLGSSGTVAPQTAINLPANTIGFGVAFDKRGTLWVADVHNSAIYGYLASQLATSGAPAPTVVLSNNATNAIFGPEQLAFNASAPAAAPVAPSRVTRPLGAAALGAPRRVSVRNANAPRAR
jgi:sugar lactone lactonase YvrE